MKGKRKLFWTLFSLLLAGLSIWAVMGQSKSLSLAQMWVSVRNANKLWLAMALLCTALFVVMEGEALRCILRGIGYHQPFRRGLLYSTADIYFSAITPSATGGQPASAYFMIKDGVPAGIVTVTLLVNLILYTVSLITVGLAAILTHFKLFLGMRLLSKLLIGIGFVILLGLTVLFFAMLRHGELIFGLLRRFLRFLHRIKLVHRLERRLAKLDTMQADFDACAKTMKGKGPTLLQAFFWNLGQRSAQIAVPMFLFLALGGRLHLAPSLFASQCLVTLGYNCVPVPGAMGVADFLMLDAFSDLMAMEEAFRLEILSRGLSFYICVAISGIITGIGYLLLKKRERN